MTKTIPLDENVHKYLKKVQLILYQEYNIEMRLQDILTYIINEKTVGDVNKVAKRIFEDTNNDITVNEGITIVSTGTESELREGDAINFDRNCKKSSEN